MKGKRLSDRYIRRIVPRVDVLRGQSNRCELGEKNHNVSGGFVVGGLSANLSWVGWLACQEHAHKFSRLYGVKMPYYDPAVTK